MERFGSRISFGSFFIFLCFCLVSILCCMLWAIADVWWPSLVLGIILVFVAIPVYFFTNYKLKEDHLEINCGLFFVGYKIKYDDIIAVVPKNNLSFAPCLSKERVMITYLKKGKTNCVYVSPNLYDLFITQITDNILGFQDKHNGTASKNNADVTPKKEIKSETKIKRDEPKKVVLKKDNKDEKKPSKTKVATAQKPLDNSAKTANPKSTPKKATKPATLPNKAGKTSTTLKNKTKKVEPAVKPQKSNNRTITKPLKAETKTTSKQTVSKKPATKSTKTASKKEV